MTITTSYTEILTDPRALQRCAQGDAGGCGRAVVLYNGATINQASRFERRLCKRLICGDLGWAIPDEGTTNLVAGAIGILAVAPAAFALASAGGVLEATGLTAAEGQRIVDEVAATESKSSGLVARAASKLEDETGAIRSVGRLSLLAANSPRTKSRGLPKSGSVTATLRCLRDGSFQKTGNA
jgi:hypothetical protein